MPDVRQYHDMYAGLIDPAIMGYDDAYWHTSSGTPAVSGSALRFNSAAAYGKQLYHFGRFDFLLTVPVAPTAGHARRWGLAAAFDNTRGGVFFDIDGTTFSCRSYTTDGTATSTTVPWDASYTAAEAKFSILWKYVDTGPNTIDFLVNNVLVASHESPSNSLALPIIVSNGVADDMDLKAIYLRGVWKTSAIGSSVQVDTTGLATEDTLLGVKSAADSTSVSTSATATNTGNINSNLTNNLASASVANGTTADTNLLQGGGVAASSPTTTTNGLSYIFRLNKYGAQYVVQLDSNGQAWRMYKEASDSLSGIQSQTAMAFQDGSGRGVFPRNPVLLEDAAHASGDPLIMAGVRRIQTLAPSGGSNLDNSVINQDENGALYVNPEATIWGRSDTFTATGNGTTVNASMSAKKWFSLQVTQTGTVTAWNVVLEGSNDNATFTTLLTHTEATGSGVTVFPAAGVATPCRYYRARCTSITLGAGTNVVAAIIGMA